VHDKALGRIGSYHLFRFPPALEDMVEKAYTRVDWPTAFKDIVSTEQACEKFESIDFKQPAASCGCKMRNKNTMECINAKYHFCQAINYERLCRTSCFPSNRISVFRLEIDCQNRCCIIQYHNSAEPAFPYEGYPIV